MSDYTEHLISMAGGDGDQLAAIEARTQAATDGPWEVDRNYPFSSDLVGIFAQDAKKYVLEVAGQGEVNDPTTSADANFIAHARTDVPALIAMVREQRAALDLIANQVNASEALCLMNGRDPELASVPAAAIRAALTATEGA
jgi:hypothetical protein